MEIGEFWVPSIANGGSDSPYTEIRERHGIRPQQNARYVSTFDTLHTVTPQRSCYRLLRRRGLSGCLSDLGLNRAFPNAERGQNEFTHIELSADGRHLYVVDTPINEALENPRLAPKILSISLTVEGEGSPDPHPSLLL